MPGPSKRKTRKHKRRQSRRSKHKGVAPQAKHSFAGGDPSRKLCLRKGIAPLAKHSFAGGDVKFYIYFYQPDGTRIPVDGQHLTKRQTRPTPHVDFFHDDQTGFVVVMYDQDAPSPARIHWLYIVHKNNVIDHYVYTPPNPPMGEVHTYTIELLSKPSRGLWGIVNELPPSRENFNIEDFKRVNGLALEARKTFTCGTIAQGVRIPSAMSVLTMRETPIQPSRGPVSGVGLSPIPMANLAGISLNTPVVWTD